MGRAPCCDKANVKKGPWSPEEDAKLKEFIDKYGTGGNWIALPHKAGLKRCGKSCRLRWLNYLRPNIKHGEFSDEEDRIICSLFASIGSRWSIIATQLPGRTDNDIKNYWNTKLKKKLLGMPPSQRKPHSQQQQQHRLPQQQQHHFSSSLQANIAPTEAPLHQVSSYTFSKPHLSGLEGLPLTQDVMNAVATAGSLFNSSVHHQQYHMKDGTAGRSSTLLMFGGDQPSCSSSDGSYNQISYGNKDIDCDYGSGGGVVAAGVQQLGLESLLYDTTGVDGEDQKLLFHGVGYASCGQTAEKGNDANYNAGLLGEVSLDYDYEEIKQLITSNNNNNNINLFSDDDHQISHEMMIRSSGRPVYYY